MAMLNNQRVELIAMAITVIPLALLDPDPAWPWDRHTSAHWQHGGIPLAQFFRGWCYHCYSSIYNYIYIIYIYSYWDILLYIAGMIIYGMIIYIYNYWDIIYIMGMIIWDDHMDWSWMTIHGKNKKDQPVTVHQSSITVHAFRPSSPTQSRCTPSSCAEHVECREPWDRGPTGPGPAKMEFVEETTGQWICLRKNLNRKP